MTHTYYSAPFHCGMMFNYAKMLKESFSKKLLANADVKKAIDNAEWTALRYVEYQQVLDTPVNQQK